MLLRMERGFTLSELLTAIAIAGLIICCAVPSWMSMRRRAAVRSAAAEIRSVFHLVRSRAISHSRSTGVKFVDGLDGWKYALYDDGDGDGVRNDDITRGTDRLVSGQRFLWQQPLVVKVAIPSYVTHDPDGDPLTARSSPVQFNRSTICSFSPLGQATAGTIYLTDDADSAWAVRVYGATAKIRVLSYDRSRRRWSER